jgi:hypothetical protein
MIAAFDLGIKNLSYCVASFDVSGLIAVERWANLNLLADGADAQSQTRCSKELAGRVCGGPASWRDGDVLMCKKCAKKSAKAFLDVSGTVADWRVWAAAHGCTAKTKKDIEAYAATIRLMPYKAPKARGVSLQRILEGMETCLNTELAHLATASLIRIENQPSEFAPHMKSIQIMLFTLIDHRLRTEHDWKGTIEFANASVKTRGAGIAAGKSNKRDRKLAAIAKVTETLDACPAAAEKLAWWRAQAKQDDLADAFLMCLDAAR